jgi:HEAT repeat protein
VGVPVCRRSPGLAVGALAVLVGIWGGGAKTADAAPRRGRPTTAPVAPSAAPTPTALSEPELARLRAALQGEDDAAAVAALRKVAEQRPPNAAEPLLDRLAAGLTPDLAAEALRTLERLREPRALQLLTLYAGNRNVEVRKAAVGALSALADERVVGTLLERLGDSAPEVRQAAAEALAARGEKRARARLLRLVEKNDAGAAGPLGTLMDPEDVPRLAELRGRIDDGVLATALGEFVKRPEIADRLRLDVVRTIGRIPGAAATTALVEYLASVPEDDPRPSREEAQKLVDARGAP